MAFQLPTTTTASVPNFSFALNTTPTIANAGSAGASVASPSFSFAAPAAIGQTPATAGGGDADTAKTGAPPQSGFNMLATSLTPQTKPAPATTGVVEPIATTATAPVTSISEPTAMFGGFSALAPAKTTAATPATLSLPSVGLTTAPKSTAAVAPVSQQLTAAVAAPIATTIAPGGTGSAFTNLSTATKTTDSATVASASQLTYHQLEEHINKWTLEFEEQEKVFTEQATQINAWDKLLISNNTKILELNDAVQKVKNDQQVLDQELEFIATQHKELEESLVPLEKEFVNLPRVDMERSQTYLMVENLDTQLKQMSEDLKEIIDNLNEANKSQENSDPIIQIGKILNAHMSSLQWIESQSSNICKKLDDVGKIQETQKRDIFRAPF